MSIYYKDDMVTLYHGDCLTEHREWLEADVLVTDPPYGMGYLSGRRRSNDLIAGDEGMAARDGSLAMWGQRPALVFGTWKRPRPEQVRQLVVWDKRGGVGYSGDLSMPWADASEEIYVIGEGWTGRRTAAIVSVPTLPSQSHERAGHPTPKPVALMESLIARAPLGTIADPFAGSGSTLVAAKRLGRKSIGVELEERYCEIAARRLSQGVLDLAGVTDGA